MVAFLQHGPSEHGHHGLVGQAQFRMVDIFAEGGMVATRVRYDGLHRETSRRITFEALENFRVENGRIVESWGYWPDREIEEKLRGESAPRSVDMPPARQTEKE